MSYTVCRVWFVQGYNDRSDIAAGGSPILGPYVWVPAEHVARFLAWVSGQQWPRRFHTQVSGARDMEGQVPPIEVCISGAAQFLNDPNNWSDP